jgi:hypothetical protein
LPSSPIPPAPTSRSLKAWQTWSNPIRFLLVYLTSLVLAALCAWAFGNGLVTVYPEGILVYPPEARNIPPEISDSFQVGMAIGWFFSSLVYALVSLSSYLFSKFGNTVLSILVRPMLAASITCGVLVAVAVTMAG